ncbi:hypothetical protein F5144DRAFT_121110 [Chaetomium tenue]|uniref:Uncharacterized protein n=1 Tax=Chaetomium tenue TaxID=1854479 RepID=A0ACB7PGV4_9PEZI|nr:hypothetical protein F5144DRAFT_121110 [Chaetomium globosum]
MTLRVRAAPIRSTGKPRWQMPYTNALWLSWTTERTQMLSTARESASSSLPCHHIPIAWSKSCLRREPGSRRRSCQPLGSQHTMPVGSWMSCVGGGLNAIRPRRGASLRVTTRTGKCWRKKRGGRAQSLSNQRKGWVAIFLGPLDYTSEMWLDR